MTRGRGVLLEEDSELEVASLTIPVSIAGGAGKEKNIEH